MFAYTTELLRVEQYGQVAPTMLAGLADVVGGDSACLTHLDLVSQQQVAIRWPSVVSDSRMIGAYPTVGHTHPIRAPLRTLARKPPASLEPIRISDVLAPRAWRQTPFHREAMPDATDQICLPMALHGAVVHAVTLTRDAGTFTDAQSAVLRVCGPHLRAVLRRSSPVSEYAFHLAPEPGWVPLTTAPGLAPRPAHSAHQANRDTAVEPNPQLSDRERQVLALVTEGLTDAQIARRLKISSATVSRHLHRIFHRHGLANRAAAAGLFLRLS